MLCCACVNVCLSLECMYTVFLCKCADEWDDFLAGGPGPLHP